MTEGLVFLDQVLAVIDTFERFDDPFVPYNHAVNVLESSLPDIALPTLAMALGRTRGYESPLACYGARGLAHILAGGVEIEEQVQNHTTDCFTGLKRAAF